MRHNFVLDSCSLIAFFREEEGSNVISDLFRQAVARQINLYLHKVTLTEVLYDSQRSDKTRDPGEIIKDIYSLPVLIEETLTNDFIIRIAYFKVSYKISFADCFVLALAETHHATVVSSDHHEFDPIATAGNLQFLWLR